jgi:TonB family protein
VSRCWQHGIDHCPQCEAAQLTQDRGDHHSQFQAFALFAGMAVAALAFVGFVCVYALRTHPQAPRSVADGVNSLGSRLARLVEREPVKKTVGASPINTAPISRPRDDRRASDGTIVVYNIGKDVTSPVVVFNPQPKYTANALRRKVQGTVVMTAVVLPDGRVTNVAVIRSLDRYSLDDVARTTAARWRFRPGLRQGVPVAVRVRIELEFKLRE